MFDYIGSFENALSDLKREQRYRVFIELEREAGRFPHAFWNGPNGERDGSNDYLGMGQHPKVIEAMCAATRSVGAGAGGTRNISGSSRAIVELESELADLHGKESALVFTSGYVSNQTGIATIAKLLPDCLILSDASDEVGAVQGWLARDDDGDTHRTGDGRQSRAVQAGERSPLATAPHLHPADQLSNGSARERASADYPDPGSRQSADRATGQCSYLGLARTWTASCTKGSESRSGTQSEGRTNHEHSVK